MLEGLGSAVVKLIVTRGPGPRSYPPPREPSAHAHRHLDGAAGLGVEAARPLSVRICETRLGRNPRLAGIKHLNRLEQVLAGAELREPAGRRRPHALDRRSPVCGTAANLFMVRDGRLLTPQISDCGVAGVMRERCCGMRRSWASTVEIGDFTLADLERADECFLTNAVRGIRPVGHVEGLKTFGARPGDRAPARGARDRH